MLTQSYALEGDFVGWSCAMSKKFNLMKRLTVPPKEWWNVFDPVYLGSALVVLFAGITRQTDPLFLTLSAVVVWSMLAFAYLIRK